ncbi:MAG TPA: ABC transporter permease [Terracidiphilus sp.]|jgi:predicted permease
MSFPGFFRSLSTAIFRRSQVSIEMEEELRSHIAHRADDLERAGSSRAEAERRARIELGARERYKEESVKALGGNWLGIIQQDVRIAWRMLRKSPGFTLISVVTLALAIGANAVVFSILNALVLRPVNVPDGATVYQIEQAQDHIPSQSYPDYVDLRDRNKSFDGLALYGIERAGLDANGTPVPAWIYEASSNYFDVLRVQPFLGRFFHASDERGLNSIPYLVLSYAYWQTHFHSDPGIVGRVVRVNNTTCTILGVAPKSFRGTEVFYAPDFWSPIVDAESADTLKGRGSRGFWVIGHLKPGVTPAQATDDLNAIAGQLKKTYPADDDGLSFGLARPGLLGNMLGGPVHAFVMGLTLLAGLILLAACANLGSLFSARAADRWREVSLRLALGSSRGRILRQLLTEALLVSLGGAAAGIAGSIMLLRALSTWQPIPDIPINVPVNPDSSTYVMALLLALFSGLLFGLVPVRQIMKADPYQGIKAAVGATQGMRRFTLRDLLLAVQIALCAVLVTSSLVAVRGMLRSIHSSFGFDPRNAMQVDTDLGMSGYKGDQVPVLQKKLLDAIEGIPGVKAAGFANRIPLNIGWSDSDVCTKPLRGGRCGVGLRLDRRLG